MVRSSLVAVSMLFLSVPCFAQLGIEDYPRVEVSMGYANLGFPDLFDIEDTKRRSGFAMQAGFNLNRWFGIENYTGFYGAGENITMISNIIGGKIAGRGARVTPYGVAGFGAGFLTDDFGRGFGSFASARLGGGVDVPLNESISIRVDLSRMSFNLDRWRSSSNILVGLSFNLFY